MARSAVALANAAAQTRSQTTSGFRDFSQPWLDLNDKSVLVTGGTGSFGKHFLKTGGERCRRGPSPSTTGFRKWFPKAPAPPLANTDFSFRVSQGLLKLGNTLAGW